MDLLSRNKLNDFHGYVEAGEFLEFDDLSIVKKDSE